MTGTIEFFNHKRGFGFINPLVGVGKDCEQVFAHLSSFVYKLGEDTQPLPQGSEVTFELVRRETGGFRQLASSRWCWAGTRCGDVNGYATPLSKPGRRCVP